MYRALAPYDKIKHLPFVVGRPIQVDGRTLEPGEAEPGNLSARARRLHYEQRLLVIAPDAPAALPPGGPVPVVETPLASTRKGKRHPGQS